MSTPLRTHNFTVDEYHRMAEAGVFHEDDRVELIDGQVRSLPAHGPSIGRREEAPTPYSRERGGAAGSWQHVAASNPLRFNSRTNAANAGDLAR